MRVHHFDGGTLRPFGGRLVDGAPGLVRRSTLACHCLLLETSEGLVLVESGVGSPTVDRANAWLGRTFVAVVNPARAAAVTAVDHVRGLGFAPEDVRHVVLTHLDLDHAGGLVDFPHATVHVHERELRALERPASAKERTRYRSVQFAHGPKFSAHGESGEPWFGFDAVRELPGLPPEILLVPLAGHTHGHVGVAVDTGDGWLLNAGDSYFFHGQLEPRPHCPPGLGLFERAMQLDAPARLRNQERLRELVAGHGDEITVFNAHDPVYLERFASTG